MTKARDLSQTPNQTPAFKNRIINGAFLIWQRGTSFTPSSVIYGADRFASYKAGASAGDYARSTDVPSGSGFTYSGYFNNADIRHPVELPVVGNAGEYVSGSTWTVSFWAKVASGSASNVVGLGFADGSAAGNFGRWGSDQSFSLTTTWQFFSRTFTVNNSPVGSNACVLLYFGATAGFHITGVQLEKGSTATSFDYRPYGAEEMLCKRYFEIGRFLQNTGGTGNNYFYEFSIPFIVEKRTSPSMTTTSGNYINTGGGNSIAPEYTVINTRSSVVRPVNQTTWAAANFNWSANSEL